jgi:MYXO-CTERM domain-containing protein
MPALQDYDYAVEHLTAQEGELVIDATSTPPFDPNVDYYAVLVHQNCPAAYAVLSTNADLPQGTGGAGGAGGSDSGGGDSSPADGGSAEDDGCGCRTAGAPAGAPSSSWGGVALLAAGLGLARRRRR